MCRDHLRDLACSATRGSEHNRPTPASSIERGGASRAPIDPARSSRPATLRQARLAEVAARTLGWLHRREHGNYFWPLGRRGTRRRMFFRAHGHRHQSSRRQDWKRGNRPDAFQPRTALRSASFNAPLCKSRCLYSDSKVSAQIRRVCAVQHLIDSRHLPKHPEHWVACRKGGSQYIGRNISSSSRMSSVYANSVDDASMSGSGRQGHSQTGPAAHAGVRPRVHYSGAPASALCHCLPCALLTCRDSCHRSPRHPRSSCWPGEQTLGSLAAPAPEQS